MRPRRPRAEAGLMRPRRPRAEAGLMRPRRPRAEAGLMRPRRPRAEAGLMRPRRALLRGSPRPLSGSFSGAGYTWLIAQFPAPLRG